MKAITVTLEDELMDAVREHARAESKTVEDLVSDWLNDYARKRTTLADFDRLTQDLRGKVRIGVKLTRDDLNER